ncbi:tripartite tricarboxylate transporter permease [Vreelandella hamiltonii]|uniref:DUF112 domain-containing protein n=1 Tax=Halomonas johnsoniae TaxID=502832 RepID=A0ABQ2WRZ4_9GAMM|nr:tripartite tricarboxylate transporter permease [Halomonas johnsoniae]GGW67553.1 hypothetical protein GCM10007158_30320 [Halomonas johnsoniae]
MEIFDNLLMGLSVAITPMNLFYLLIGASIGMMIGAIPGFGPSAGIAILLPLTFSMDPISAVMMLAAIYYGAMYGGTITAILLNTPGDSTTVASTFDGFPLAQQGRAGPALVMQASASFVGGTIGVILITLLAPVFSLVTRSFGPPEFFLLCVMGLLTLVALMSGNWILGLISALIGFALGTVGVDLETGHQRFTFGSVELIGGVNFIPVAIGLFGIGELFYAFYNGAHKSGSGGIIQYKNEARFWPTRKDVADCKYTMPRNSILGFLIGVIPGAGATIASLMAYSLERSFSRNPQKFGKGEMRGLVAPESANNAASSGAMVPLLTLGIPGSASTAVLLAAFLMWGLRPGPLLMEQNPEFAWGLISSMYLGNMALLALSIFAIPLFVYIIKAPYRILAPIVLVVCTLGTFSVNASIIETFIMLGAGVVGFLMKRYGFSPAAVVLALVLGPMAEESLRQTLLISRGSFDIFLTRQASIYILFFFAATILGGVFLNAQRRREKLKEKTI